MADSGVVDVYLAGLTDTNTRRILNTIFKYILKDIRFGRSESGEASTNLGGGFFTATTPSVANTEFTVPHSFGRAPYLLVPVVPLDAVNSQIVPLKITRAADASRIYLSSSSTSAVVFFFLEG